MRPHAAHFDNPPGGTTVANHVLEKGVKALANVTVALSLQCWGRYINIMYISLP